VNIDGAQNIRGWMHDGELAWLAEQASKASTIIEIGCAYGRSTLSLAGNTAGIIYAIDTWAGSADERGTNHADFREHAGDRAMIEFCENLWQPIVDRKIIPLRIQSSNAAALLARQGIAADFIFIDGDHAYEAVRSDITNFLPLLAPGGIFAGHDYDENWPGVMRAVDELLPGSVPLGRIWLRAA
jgi:predicted O-methyltransferase YrrM